MLAIITLALAVAANSGGSFPGSRILSAIFVVIAPLFCVWALIDAIVNHYLDRNLRIFWIALIVLLPVLGALAYAFIGRAPPTDLDIRG